MFKLAMGLLVAAFWLLAACSGGDAALEMSASRAAGEQSGFGASSDAASLSEASTQAKQGDPGMEFGLTEEAAEAFKNGDGFAGSANVLQAARREVISTAEITLSVEVVQTAINRAQSTAERMGGFVERLSSSGGPGRQNATMTLRVPQAQFYPAVSGIESLGVVQSRNLGAMEVSAQFIDLEARLKSSSREEESLLGLLERTQSVSEILAIERELFRVRADIERAQGQLNFLERRVDLATIDLTLVPLDDQVHTPPSANFVIYVDDVDESVRGIKTMVEEGDGRVDRVFFSINPNREEADLGIRVYTQDFVRVVALLDELGEVRSKSLTESSGAAGNNPDPSGRPEAEISIVLLNESGGGSFLLVLGIILGVVVAIVAALLLIRLVSGLLPFGRSEGDERFA